MSDTKMMAAKGPRKTGLGRGLGSLLGGPEEAEAPTQEQTNSSESHGKSPEARTTKTAQVPTESRIWQMDIAKIVANPNQPRKEFDKEELGKLSASIQSKGILQPIVVRQKTEDQFEIIAGERRWRAAQQAGLHNIPVLVRKVQDQDALELALIENIQREDLNPIEEAQAYEYLMEAHGLTQQRLAERVGKERATIANVLRLTTLEPQVQEMVKRHELSLGQAKLLLQVEEPKAQRKLAHKIKDDKMTVRASKKLIDRTLKGPSSSSSENETPASTDRLIQNLSQEMQKMLGTKVSINYNSGRGQIQVQFYSDEELNSIVEKFRKTWQS